jgi:hypothetical protein
METTKIKTDTTINYAINISGNYFAIRSYTNGSNKIRWEVCSFKSNMICTDKYICRVGLGFETKKEAVEFLEQREKEFPKGFYHNDIE